MLVYCFNFRLDNIYDNKVKAQNWDKLAKDFDHVLGGRVSIPKAQIVRKWHNWKQYNKQRSKPHPFKVVGPLDEDEVLSRCHRLVAWVDEGGGGDPSFLTDLLPPSSDMGAQEESEEIPAEAGGVGDPSGEVHEGAAAARSRKVEQVYADHPHLARLQDLHRSRDFRVGRTGVSAYSLSVKRLEHEIVLASLTYEQEKWKVKLENQELVRHKLLRQAELASLQLEKARTELEMKKQECASLGIHIEF